MSSPQPRSSAIEQAVDALLDERSVRAVIPVGHTKYSELVTSGKLYSVRIGRRRFVPESAVRAYIDSLTGGEGAA